LYCIIIDEKSKKKILLLDNYLTLTVGILDNIKNYYLRKIILFIKMYFTKILLVYLIIIFANLYKFIWLHLNEMGKWRK